MRLKIAYSKIKKGNLVLINNATYQRETLSERPIRQPLRKMPTSGFTNRCDLNSASIYSSYSIKLYSHFVR